MIRPRRIGHATFETPDLEKAIAYYTETMGLVLAAREKDGRVIRDMYLFQVKTPDESKYPYDYFKQLAVVPGDKAFRPLSESVCPLVKK